VIAKKIYLDILTDLHVFSAPEHEKVDFRMSFVCTDECASVRMDVRIASS
jgi:hypothetical protein